MPPIHGFSAVLLTAILPAEESPRPRRHGLHSGIFCVRHVGQPTHPPSMLHPRWGGCFYTLTFVDAHNTADHSRSPPQRAFVARHNATGKCHRVINDDWQYAAADNLKACSVSSSGLPIAIALMLVFLNYRPRRVALHCDIRGIGSGSRARSFAAVPQLNASCPIGRCPMARLPRLVISAMRSAPPAMLAVAIHRRATGLPALLIGCYTAAIPCPFWQWPVPGQSDSIFPFR